MQLHQLIGRAVLRIAVDGIGPAQTRALRDLDRGGRLAVLAHIAVRDLDQGISRVCLRCQLQLRRVLRQIDLRAVQNTFEQRRRVKIAEDIRCVCRQSFQRQIGVLGKGIRDRHIFAAALGVRGHAEAGCAVFQLHLAVPGLAVHTGHNLPGQLQVQRDFRIVRDIRRNCERNLVSHGSLRAVCRIRLAVPGIGRIADWIRIAAVQEHVIGARLALRRDLDHKLAGIRLLV